MIDLLTNIQEIICVCHPQHASSIGQPDNDESTYKDMAKMTKMQGRITVPTVELHDSD